VLKEIQVVEEFSKLRIEWVKMDSEPDTLQALLLDMFNLRVSNVSDKDSRKLTLTMIKTYASRLTDRVLQFITDSILSPLESQMNLLLQESLSKAIRTLYL
jgi:hypothetical protein